MRKALLASCLIGAMALSGATFAQDAAVNPPVAVDASLQHAATKGITLKAAVALKNWAIFTVGLGTMAGGGALTILASVNSYIAYVANEYLWDYFDPNTNISANSAAFNKQDSAWRNTAKYLTFKPASTTLEWATIYWFTGSWTAMLAMGSVTAITGPIVFYGNNIGWDWYDWYNNPGSPAEQQPTPSAPSPAVKPPHIAWDMPLTGN